MAWQDRVRTAEYRSPSGRQIAFDYEDVSRETEKRTAAFAFPGVNENFIQDNGFGARRYALRCFFSGTDYDIAATEFEIMVLESGIGRLTHPLYGIFDVVPFGSIKRRDDLKTGANQAIIEVTFWTTTRLLFPDDQKDARNELETVVADFIAAGGPEQFATTVDVRTAIARESLASRTKALLAGTNAALSKIAQFTTEVNNEFRDAQDAINFSIDVLVGQPLNLAQQMLNLISLPARATAGITSRILAYADFAAGLFSSAGGLPADAVSLELPRRKTDISNDFHATDMSAAGAINGALLSVIETEFKTRPAAIEAADSVLQIFDDWVVWREAGFEALGQVDDGTSYQALLNGAGLVAGFLVQISFTLLPERLVILDRARTIIDLTGELYGTVSDARINDLINDNNLTGSEIIEIPRDREIVFYRR